MGFDGSEYLNDLATLSLCANGAALCFRVANLRRFEFLLDYGPSARSSSST